MSECNSIETSNLYNQLFRLNKVNETKDYFIAEIKERELMTKRLSKYIASFDYFDKSLIVLSATSGSISIASFATVFGIPLRIATLIINRVVSKTSNGRTMVLPKCAICGSKKSRFIKKQEAKGILTSLGFKTELDKIPFFGDYLL